MEQHTLLCKYCAHEFIFSFVPDEDYPYFEDILEYDYSVQCERCGCPVRVNESLLEEDEDVDAVSIQEKEELNKWLIKL